MNMINNTKQPKFLNRKEIMALLGFSSINTLYKFQRESKLPFFKICGRELLAESDLMNYIERMKANV